MLCETRSEQSEGNFGESKTVVLMWALILSTVINIGAKMGARPPNFSRVES